jgi:hypothetical protein
MSAVKIADIDGRPVVEKVVRFRPTIVFRGVHGRNGRVYKELMAAQNRGEFPNVYVTTQECSRTDETTMQEIAAETFFCREMEETGKVHLLF